MPKKTNLNSSITAKQKPIIMEKNSSIFDLMNEEVKEEIKNSSFITSLLKTSLARKFLEDLYGFFLEKN